MNPAIEINALTKTYGALTALDAVDLSVARGEMFGLIGPDGAGKSSLFRILATLAQPDSGTARVCGLDTSVEFSSLRSLIGYMPERFSLYSDLTVAENLHFFASLFGVDVKTNFELIAPIFNQLKRFPNRRAGKLSGGMKQKLALSCALIHRPQVLLLDEPTTGVDAVSRSEFWDMLGGLRRLGITILVSTSYMDEATRCDRIAIIDHGKILRIGSPDALVAGLGENLYDAVGPDMFNLLTGLREMPEVDNCYTFGSTLHVVARKGFNPSAAMSRLNSQGLHDVKITPAKGNIEDLFIKLTLNDAN